MSGNKLLIYVQVNNTNFFVRCLIFCEIMNFLQIDSIICLRYFNGKID
jgi:hypothetical protein